MTVLVLWAAVAAGATALLDAAGRVGFFFVPLFFVGLGVRRDARAYGGAAIGAVVAGVLLGSPLPAIGGFGVAATLYGLTRLVRLGRRDPDHVDH